MSYFLIIILFSYKNQSLNTNFGNLLSSINDINARLIYIEENLGTLTREEYTTNGTISITCSGRVGKTVQIAFNKIFLEPPSVTANYTYNEDNDFDGITISNITTTGFDMYTAYSGNSSKTCTIAWNALGYISKQS